MKLTIILVCLPLSVSAQGVFAFLNPTAPTRLDSIDGPLAGRGIWGQALVGLTTDSLTPVGMPAEHVTNGRIAGTQLSVPFADAATTVFVQMAAWDGTLWGSDFARVPPDQLGHTDTVPVLLSLPLQTIFFPRWTESAIVPTVPEPSTTALAFTAGLVLVLVIRKQNLHGLGRPRVPAGPAPPIRCSVTSHPSW